MALATLNKEGKLEDASKMKEKGTAMTNGVIITCVGDQKHYGLKQYVSYDVPPDHFMFTKGLEPVPISILLGFPILTWRLPHNLVWLSDQTRGKAPEANQAALYLHMQLDPTSAGFGVAPKDWCFRRGSVLAVREDGTDLTPKQMEVICNYCRYVLSPKIAKVMEETNFEAPGVDHPIMSSLTEEDFKEFWTQYTAGKGLDEPCWGMVESPYTYPWYPERRDLEDSS